MVHARKKKERGGLVWIMHSLSVSRIEVGFVLEEEEGRLKSRKTSREQGPKDRLQWYVMAAGNGSEGSISQLIERREYRCFY